MVATPDELREMAEECRSLAAIVKAPEIQQQLLEIGESFMRLARRRYLVEITTSPNLKQARRSE